METPPSTTGPHRLNYMQYRRGEEDESGRHELLSKFGPSTYLFIKSIIFTKRKQDRKWLKDKTFPK